MIFLVNVNVIMKILLKNDGMNSLLGADSAKLLSDFGSIVILIFTTIFSLYTNIFSQTTKKRTRVIQHIMDGKT